jgi:RNA polymerase sigma factor (sigma-70 family)
MPAAQAGAILRHIHYLAGNSSADEPADAELLRRFVTMRDETAFATLLRRHGRLVWGVCRRVLQHEQQAEDAFQATFLVLARRPECIQKGTSLASFLYGVAYRVAVRIQQDERKRRSCERQRCAMPASSVVSEAAWRELQALLDEELMRLPEKLRAPFVLCCLEGKSRDEAACELGWKQGTVSSRIAKARSRLQQRLARRGVTLAAVLCAADLGQHTAQGALREAALRAALAAAGKGRVAVSGAASAAAAAVHKTMAAGSKGKVVGALLLALVPATLGVLAQGAPSGKSAAEAGKQVRLAAPADAPRLGGFDCYGDALPPEALARLGTVRLRHGFIIYALAYSPDGKVLASAGGGRGLCLWDAGSGKLLHELVPVKHVYGIAFSPDSKLLAGSDGVRVLHLWDVATGKEVRFVAGNDGGVTMAVAFSPDGKVLASGGHDKLVRLWDVASGEEIRQLRGYVGTIRSVVFSPDGQTIAAGGADKSIRLWAAGTGAPRGVLAGHKADALWIAFSPNGKLLVSGSDDGTLRLWDTAAANELRVLGEVPGRVGAVAFSPDGAFVASGHADGKVRLWDPVHGKELRQWPAHAALTDTLTFSPDGKELVTGAMWDSSLRRWDPATGHERHPFGGPRGLVHWLAFAPDARALFIASRDQTLRRWEWARDRDETLFTAPSGFYDCHALNADGPRAAVCKADHTIHVWEGKSEQATRVLKGYAQHLERIRALAFSADGRLLASGGTDRSLCLWDIRTGKVLCQTEGLADEVACIDFAPDGKTLVTGSGGNRAMGLRLWDTATLKELHTFDCAEDVYRVLFSPDGKLLASAGGGYPWKPRLWDVATGKERTLRDVVKKCSALAFTADSKLLALGSEEPENSVAVIEIASLQQVRCFRGHKSGVCSAAFSADGRLLATGGGDALVHVWDLTGRRATVSARAPMDMEKCWDALADTDAARAYAVQWDLAAVPDQAVRYLREHLPPAVPLDDAGRGKVKQWIAELDSEMFSVRRAAAKELEKRIELCEPALRDALTRKPTPEARRQLKDLLEVMSSWTTERLRIARAVTALEHMRTQEARRLLEDLAKGVPGALQTREARKALERLAGRP